MPLKVVLIAFLISILITTGCMSENGKKIDSLLKNDNYKEARSEIEKLLKKEPGSGKNHLLYAETWRCEYFPTWDANQFITPINENWQFFPAEEFQSYNEYTTSLEKAAENGYIEECGGEYYFLICYNYNRWKYFQEEDSKYELKKYLEQIESFENKWQDNANFWSYYVSSGRTINYDWSIMEGFWEKYPRSELSGLKILTQFMIPPQIDNHPKPDNFVIERLKEYKKNYRDFAIIADSLFIYNRVKPVVTHYRKGGLRRKNYQELTAFLDQIIEAMLSSRINHYCIWEKGKLSLENGEINEGFSLLEKVIEQEMNKYNRDILNRVLLQYAVLFGDTGRIVRSSRQLKEPQYREKLHMWEAYLDLDHEVEADNLREILEKEATDDQKKVLKKIQYQYDLSKIEVIDLNTVITTDQVSISGKVRNKTRKRYEDVEISITVSDKKSNERSIDEHILPVLYPETSVSFNRFISFNNPDNDIVIEAKIEKFKKALKD